MPTPHLTVALPTCNGAAHLRETLRSILAQDEVAFDLIVCDDRSDDDTLAIVREIAGDRAHVEENSERLGLAGNWNRCVLRSQTPIVAIFHQDDLMRPGHLRAHRHAFTRDPKPGLVASASGVVDASGRGVAEAIVGRGGMGAVDRVFGPGEAIDAMSVENPLRCSAVTLWKPAHQDVGGFAPSFRYVVDWDFWIRVARTWSVSWLAEPTVDVRWHAASETHRFKTGTADLDETLRMLDTIPLRPGTSLRSSADRRVARAFLNRAYESLRGGNADLAHETLRRAVRLWPGILGRIVIDPRLAAQMAALTISPRWASRVFGLKTRRSRA